MSLDTRRWKGPVLKLIGERSAISLPDYAAMRAALPGEIPDGALVVLSGRSSFADGGEGMFRWVPGDQSAEVALDPMNGVWVPPDADPTGARGAWQRVHDNVFDPNWFGCVGDGVADDNPHYVGGQWAEWEQRPLYMAAKYAAEKRAILDFKGRTYRTTFAVVVPSYSQWRGPGTIYQTGTDQAIRNTCIHLGTWHPGYFADFTAYELSGTAAAGQTTFTFTTAANAQNFEVGDFVIIRSMAGSSGPIVTLHPEFAQITQITAIDYDTGVISVADELLRGGFDVEIHHAESDTITDTPIRHPMRVCAYADIRDITLINDRFAAFERGGCYRSSFHFPFVKALDLIASNALQSSTIHIERGEFNRILSETAGNSLNMNIRVDHAIYRKTAASQARPIIVTRERCTYCNLYFPQVRADEYDWPNALINIASVGCKLHVGNLYARSAPNMLVQYQSADGPPAPAPGRPLLVPTSSDNELTIDMAFVGSMSAVVYFNPSIHPDWGLQPGEQLFRNHIKHIRIASGGTFSAYAVMVTGVHNVIEDFYSESGQARIGASAVNCKVRGHFGDGVQVLAGGERNDVLISSNSWSDLVAALAVTQVGQGTSVTSTTTGNSVHTVVVPGTGIVTRDRYTISVRGYIQGTNGNKRFRLVRNSSQTVMDLTADAAQEGYFALDILVTAQFGYPNGRFRFFTDVNGEVAWTGQVRGASPGAVDLTAGDLELDLQAWVANASDEIVIESLDVKPWRARHA